MTDELQRKVDRAVKLIQAAGKVAKEWEDEDNAPVLEEILHELKKHKGL